MFVYLAVKFIEIFLSSMSLNVATFVNSYMDINDYIIIDGQF